METLKVKLSGMNYNVVGITPASLTVETIVDPSAELCGTKAVITPDQIILVDTTILK